MDVDTSTYPKPPPPVTPFDTANEIGGLLQRQQSLQSGQLTINKQQLDLAKQAYDYMGQAINSLGPNPTRDQIIGVGQKMVDMKLVPESMIDAMEARIPTDPKAIPGFMNEWAAATADHAEQINLLRGQPQLVDTGQGLQPVSVSPINGIRSTGLPIQKQLPPGTPTVNPANGQPGYLGPQSPTAAPGAVAMPPPAVGARAVQSPPLPPANVSFSQPNPNKDQSRVATSPAAPSFVPSGMPPLFDAGKQQYVEDQNTAVARQTAIKPALQALPLLKGLQSGPGTAQWNEAIAGLKAFGILPTSLTNDPTATYQEVEKKLAQYVSGNPVGQRSDAAQALSEASSPNPKHQINPALIKLTKDAIGLDRLASMRSSAFTDNNGQPRQDFQNYGNFRSQFPAQIDEKALTLDLMDPKDRTELLDQMKSDANSKDENKKYNAMRFWNSLKQVKQLGIYNVGSQ